ncbi:MAG TPA: DUF4350 domain-containing protein [Clostridiaceae bacterium]|nr:DUF4350 domain-containing protein [Clostridiaceae bacterium]HHV99080.1 DUF4350 domain-containing protein [Clostridiaceae bacterium]
MKHNKKIPKIFAFRILILVISCALIITYFLPSEAYSAKSNADIEMEVKAGYDGIARLGAYVPYKILLINKGRAVEGEVQIEVKVDSESKVAFSKPVSLPQGAVKELEINAPVFTARRGVQVKFLEGKKTIKEMEYTFTKLIPPDIKTIGVLSSDNAAYSFLNGAKLPQMNDIMYEEKIRVMQAAGLYPTATRVITKEVGADTIKVESTLIPLTAEDLPQDIKAMVGFDILIISNFDTGTLTTEQLDTLEKWVEDGGTLVIGTGASWKKTYSPLPDALKKFSVSGIDSVEPPVELEEFSGTEFTGNVNLNTVNGDIGFEYKKEDAVPLDDDTLTEGQDTEQNKEQDTEWDKTQESKSGEMKEEKFYYSAHTDEVIIGDNTRPFAVKYIHGSGRILFLTFDPGVDPVANWNGKQSFWENLLFHCSNINRVYQSMPGYYLSSYNNNYYFDDLAGQVPEDKTPPFMFMFVTIAVYIIVVGPVIYIFLKRKDRRDYNWLVIPAVAFVFLLVIYLVGFKTRYRTAVLNTVSLINLDMGNQKADITTGMGIFNNKRGDLVLSYSEKDNIDFNVAQSGRRGYVVYDDGKEPDGRLISRLVLSDPVNYELYDVSMWEPKYLTAQKSESFQEKIINSVQISDGKIKAVIDNTTKYDLMDAFITIGSNFISVGDIPSGQQKTVEVDLNSKDIYKSYEEYLNAKYGRSYYPQNMKPPANFRENRRKRLLIERLLIPQYERIRGQTKIGLYALNYQNLGYDVKINGEHPAQYFTNGIFSCMDMNFEAGQKFDIPAGIIIPEISEQAITKSIDRIDGDYGLSIRDVGDIDFIYNIPENMKITEFSLKFDTYVPLYIKYNIEDMQARNKNLQARILQNKYEYYLYNKASNSWEKINDNHIQSENIDRYIDENNRLVVRVSVVEIANADPTAGNEYIEFEYLSYPGLQLKGVAQ